MDSHKLTVCNCKGTSKRWLMFVRTGGSRHTGQAAPPHQNIQAVQEIVPLLIVDDENPQSPIVSEVEHNTRIGANDASFAAELMYNGISVRISNDIRKDLLYTIFSCLGGSTC